MIALVSDTHSVRGHELAGAALEAVEDAAAVVHAGDFTTVETLEAFEDVATRLVAVCGNADDRVVRERLPEREVADLDGVRIAVVHRPEGGEEGLAAFGRSEDADVVVFGHTHRPTIVDTGGPLLVNPGSHAQPRGNVPGFATVEESGDGITVDIRRPDGSLVDSSR